MPNRPVIKVIQNRDFLTATPRRAYVPWRHT